MSKQKTQFEPIGPSFDYVKTGDNTFPYSEYPTQLPPTFPIGFKEVAPLVTVTEIQAHLRLLGALEKLKTHVETVRDKMMSKEEAWVIFVNRAVWRFYKLLDSPWPNFGVPASSEATMPPLDVLMVWHAYLLNPRSYYEDSHRDNTLYNKNLRALTGMSITLVAACINEESLYPNFPSREREAYFKSITGLDYGAPLVTHASETLELCCPRCSAGNQFVHWWRPDGRGFAQADFKAICTQCQNHFTRKIIGLRRFGDEALKRLRGEVVYFSETLLDPTTGVVKPQEAHIIGFYLLRNILRHGISPEKIARLKDGSDIANDFDWNEQTLMWRLLSGVVGTDAPGITSASTTVYRIQQAYLDCGLASVELVGAVLRQGDFIQKIVNLGWSTPNQFNDPSKHGPLVRCIARYHAFLWLMAAWRNKLFVPTLDIDLAWHTHQLNAQKYRHDTLNALYRTPNHEDSIAVNTLSSAYDITAKVWREAFGVPYSLCGCALEKHKGPNIFSKLKSRLFDKKIFKPPGLRNVRPDLVSTEPEDADATHPSEHNMAPSDPTAKWAFRRERKKALRRSKRAQKACANEKTYNGWVALQLAKHGQNQENGTHEHAFTKNRGETHYQYWGVGMHSGAGFYGGAPYSGGIGGCGGTVCASGGGCGGGGCGG